MSADVMLCPICNARVELNQDVKPAQLARTRALREHIANTPGDARTAAHYAAIYLLAGAR